MRSGGRGHDGGRLCRGRPSGSVRGQVGSETGRVRVVAVQHGHQVADVGRGQPERFDFGQFGVGRHVRYAVPEVGERVVDALRAPPFLFVGCVTALDHTHHGPRGMVRRCRRRRRRIRRTQSQLMQLQPFVVAVATAVRIATVVVTADVVATALVQILLRIQP